MVFFWPWRAAVVNSSPERLDANSRRLRDWNPPITDELISELAFHGQHAFALGTVIALAESRPDLGKRWPSRLVATPPPNVIETRQRRVNVVPAASALPATGCLGARSRSGVCAKATSRMVIGHRSRENDRASARELF